MWAKRGDRLVRYDAPLEYREGNGETILSIDARRMVSATGWWDPAYGAPGLGDASVVAAVSEITAAPRACQSPAETAA